jgi:hypothetical protein
MDLDARKTFAPGPLGVLRQATSRIATEDVKSAGEGVLHDFDETYEARRKILLFKVSSKFAMHAIADGP